MTNTGLRTEIEPFFNHPDWLVAAIPDPADEDPRIYAILAVLPQFFVTAFNRLISKGLPRGIPTIIIDEEERSRPIILETHLHWLSHVPRLETKLKIPDSDGGVPESQYLSLGFVEMNIEVAQPHVMFV